MTIDKYGRHIAWNGAGERSQQHVLGSEDAGGAVNLEHNKIVNLNDPEDPKDAVNKKYLDFRMEMKNRAGNTVDFDGKIIRHIGEAKAPGDGINKKFLTRHVPYMLHESDPGYTCRLKKLTNVGRPTHANDAVTLEYMVQYVRECIQDWNVRGVTPNTQHHETDQGTNLRGAFQDPQDQLSTTENRNERNQ